MEQALQEKEAHDEKLRQDMQREKEKVQRSIIEMFYEIFWSPAWEGSRWVSKGLCWDWRSQWEAVKRCEWLQLAHHVFVLSWQPYPSLSQARTKFENYGEIMVKFGLNLFKDQPAQDK